MPIKTNPPSGEILEIFPTTNAPSTITVPDVDYAYLNLFANKLADLTTAINNLTRVLRGQNG